MLQDPVIAGIILDVWEALPQRFPTLALDEFVLMPNHVHFNLWLQAQDAQETTPAPPQRLVAAPAPSDASLAIAAFPVAERTWTLPDVAKVNPKPVLGDVVGAFKSLVFTVYLDWVQAHDTQRQARFWQRNFYEHVVRNERELRAIRQYIRDNPARWNLDRDNLDGHSSRPPATCVEDYLAEIHALME